MIECPNLRRQIQIKGNEHSKEMIPSTARSKRLCHENKQSVTQEGTPYRSRFFQDAATWYWKPQEKTRMQTPCWRSRYSSPHFWFWCSVEEKIWTIWFQLFRWLVLQKNLIHTVLELTKETTLYLKIVEGIQ